MRFCTFLVTTSLVYPRAEGPAGCKNIELIAGGRGVKDLRVNHVLGLHMRRMRTDDIPESRDQCLTRQTKESELPMFEADHCMTVDRSGLKTR